MLVSIFNDVIGPVMRGASSSHCAAALQAAGTGIRIETVDAGDPHPNTYRLTLARGGRRHSLRAISTGGGMIEVIAIDDVPLSAHGDYHETLVFFTGDDAATAAARLVTAIERRAPAFLPDAIAVRNGPSAAIVQIETHDALPADAVSSFAAACEPTIVRQLEPVLPVRSRRGMSVPFSSAAELLTVDAGRGVPLWLHGARGLRGGDSLRRGRDHRQASRGADAPGTPLHGPRRPLDHAGVAGDRSPARRPQSGHLRRRQLWLRLRGRRHSPRKRSRR